MPQGPVDPASTPESGVATAGASASDSASTDARALELRGQGKGLKAIARELGFQRVSEANAAFNRALRRRPVEEQAVIRAAEESRLDSLADAVRGKEELAQGDVDRRLRAIDRLRAALLAE